MKKLIIIIFLACISITGYSQRKETKAFVNEKRMALDAMNVLNTSAQEYKNLMSAIESYSRTLSKRGDNVIPTVFIWDYMPKNEQKVLYPLYLAARDSLSKRFAYDREIEKLEKIRIQNREDSIRHIKEKERQQIQDSLKIVQELKQQRKEAIRDSISQEKAKDPDFNVIESKGSGTFSNSPNVLAQIFTKNATVESIVATFQRYIAYYAEEFPGGRRERSYDVYKNKEHYSVKLEYDAKTRKVNTIIIDDPNTDKYKQRLLNAGYRWDSGSSMTATSFGHGYRSYWKKKGSPIFFSINDRTIKVFRMK
ncbi:hypothetical protein [Dysgonomonas sp.]